MSSGDQIEERLVNFAVRIIAVCEAMPGKPAAKHIRGQLLRSGTAPAPNYGEARGAESAKDFVHKLRIVLKELNETRIWLKIVAQTNMLPAKRPDDLLDECDQLCRIMSASIHTARKSAAK